jgi:hypothetical protein
MDTHVWEFVTRNLEDTEQFRTREIVDGFANATHQRVARAPRMPRLGSSDDKGTHAC